jgi:Putative zinc-finger
VPDHPDREQLAAFQAGDGDRRQRAQVQAHLAGCPSCAQVVVSVEQARRRLAVLEEPDLPPGLHDRLAAAVEAEAAQPAPATRPAPWYRRRSAGRPHAHTSPGRRDARPAPWYRRPVAWGAAAALLLAALIVPFLDRSSGNLTTAGGGAGDSSQEAATASGAAGSVPVIRIPGEVSVATVRSRLATDRRAKDALDAASAAPGPSAPGSGAPGAGAPGSGVPGAQAATPRASQGAGPGTQSPDQADGYRSSASAPSGGAAHLQPCLPAASAAANPATRPLRPAFFIQGSYRGREATILVTTSAGQPGRVDLWVFPRDTCSSRPLESEQVR